MEIKRDFEGWAEYYQNMRMLKHVWKTWYNQIALNLCIYTVNLSFPFDPAPTRPNVSLTLIVNK